MKRYVWFLVAAAAVTLLLSVAGRVGLFGESPPAAVTERGSQGEALVGGPFELVDHTGNTVVDEDFRGDYMLVFFGFVSCPDICPTTLMTMTQALDALGEDGEAVRPIFITVDPENDDPATIGAYVDHFHPRFVGLTGTPEQVAAAARAYRVYHAKIEDPGSALGYMVDHSGFVYLMDPDGRYLAHFSHYDTAEAMADKMRALIAG